MKEKYVKWGSIVTLGLLLAGCQASESKEEEAAGSEAVAKEQIDEQHSHESEHQHTHSHEEDKQVYAGYFEDSQVQDRSLSDWEGDWQSVYPFVLDGTLDEVFTHKAEHKGDKSAEEYKKYYEAGYKTNTERIIIKGDFITFFKNGKEYEGKYQYDGYEILTYEAGNRGVRYIFKLTEPVEGLPLYIQFSDHGISPTDAGHYHLYSGDNREALLKEVTNWPTYYPSDMNGSAIAHEMMAH